MLEKHCSFNKIDFWWKINCFWRKILASKLTNLILCQIGNSVLHHLMNPLPYLSFPKSSKSWFYFQFNNTSITLLDEWRTVQYASLGGSFGCAVQLKTRRSQVQPLPRSATFFHGDWLWNIFYGHSLPLADSRRTVVSFWRKNVHNTS